MTTDPAKKLKRLRALSQWLDSAVAIPGTKYKVGFDPLISLIPGIGDYVGLILASYVIFESAKLGAKQETLVKMALNILVDSAVGTVPLAGDIFDVAWKANEANLKLLEQDLPEMYSDLAPGEKAPISWLPLVLIFGAIALILLLSSFLAIWLLRAIFAVIAP
ncbi:DUF4112 domain-containing protein [Picosynechococcus sp. NKBG15041c]|uniref:DUF4112 domain-containing protein n=1 Tax=Picosynechococcus sp. NKBG15041c TaxID=1407650 RepID=UPI0004166D25|nr:DUF4112 domain-containing protein [Picosynechococcus sp. NKBG15041c]